eukprot:scaffold39917_cov49-Phaeocystis_antarctica.AAC.1
MHMCHPGRSNLHPTTHHSLLATHYKARHRWTPAAHLNPTTHYLLLPTHYKARRRWTPAAPQPYYPLLTAHYSLLGAPPLDASGAPRPSRVVGYCSAAPRARASAKVLPLVSE